MSWALRARRLPDVLLDFGVVGFGLWTVCCHAVVVAKGTGYALFATAATVFGLALAGVGFLVFRRARVRAPAPVLADVSDGRGLDRAPAAASALPVPLSVLGLLGGALVLGSWQLWHDGWTFWLACLLFVVASSVVVLWKPLPAELDSPPDPPGNAATLGLYGLGLVGLLTTLFMVQSNTDDVLYVAIGVALADHPEHVLFTKDTLHGGDAMAFFVPYTMHSFELLAGALAWISGLEVLDIMHLGFASYAGLLTAFAWARLFRLLEPARFLGLTAIVVSWYIFDVTSRHSIPGHAFLRFFQGKSVLLTVALPLICAYAIGFVLRPSGWRWLLLATSTISGIGLSSTGIWLSPLIAFTALFIPFALRKSFFKAAGLGATTLLYPFGVALWVKSALQPSGGSAADGAAAPGPPLWLGRDEMPAVIEAFKSFLGTFGHTNNAYDLYVATLVLAWPLARTMLARRYLLAFMLGGFAILMNPHLASFVAHNITGAATQSRALWYFPFAASFATCLGAALPTARSKLRLSAATLITVAALHQFYVHVPRDSAFGYFEFPPRLKVHATGYQVARYLVKNVDEERSVLAPPTVSLVLPMLRHHPYTVITKPKFLERAEKPRFGMRMIVDGRLSPLNARRARKFVRNLGAYGVGAVVLTDKAAQDEGLAGALRKAGFRRTRSFDGHHVWLSRRGEGR